MSVYKKFALVTLITLTGLLSGCSSLEEKASEQMEEGNYEQAVIYYEQALAKDPDDAEIRAGLRNARLAYLKDELIKVRVARQAGNNKQALDLLLNVINKQSKWENFKLGAASYTQEEEISLNSKNLQNMIFADLKAKLPLKAEWNLKLYEPILNAAGKGLSSKMAKKIAPTGRKRCKEFSKSLNPDQAYFSGFVYDYCKHFKGSTKISKKYAANIWNKLFGSVKIKYLDTNLSSFQKSQIRKLMNEALKESPWYSPKGRQSLNIEVSGAYDYKHTEQIAEKIHSYKEKVPYETIRKERKLVRTPKKVTKRVFDAKTGTYIEKETIVYEEKWTTVQVPSVEYKLEDRMMPYLAKHHVQNFNVNLSINTVLAENELPVSISNSRIHEDYSHNVSMPEKKLKKDPLNLINEGQWFETNAKALTKKFTSKSKTLWTTLYCDESTTHKLGRGEMALRCSRAFEKKTPTFVASWFREKFSLEPVQALSLLR
jgi:hypothetical protein